MKAALAVLTAAAMAVFLSAAAHAAGAEGDGFISKPIDRAKLLEAIRKWSDRREAGQEAADRPDLPGPDSTKGAEIIDLKVLKALSESLGEVKTGELVDMYVTDIEARLARIQSAAESRSLDTIRKEAHDLRSTSGSLGLTRLFALGEGIENACADGRDADALRLSAEVPDAGEKTIAALRATQ